MLELKLQRFGGRGGSSGGSGKQSSGRQDDDYFVEGLPKVLDDDYYRIYEIRITEGSKTRTEMFYGTRWQVAEKQMAFVQARGLTYSQFLRGTKYTYSPMQPARDLADKKHVNEMFKGKGQRNEYKRSKREFWEKYRKFTGRR